MRKQQSRDSLIVDSKDVEQQIGAAHTVVRATYAYPFQMHGSIGASCAVADVKPKQATVWSATQSAYPTRSIVAKLLEFPVDSVRVIYVRGSGCYGLNGADTVSFDAALLSHAVGRPVRVQLSRQDEMVWENFGSAFVIDQRAGIDQNGNIVAWECESWMASRGNRPGYDQPGNVITGFLVGYTPERVTPMAPLSQQKNCTMEATPCLHMLRAASAVNVMVREPSGASAFCRIQLSPHFLPAPCARRDEYRTPLPTSLSWTRSVRARNRIRWRRG